MATSREKEFINADKFWANFGSWNAWLRSLGYDTTRQPLPQLISMHMERVGRFAEEHADDLAMMRIKPSDFCATFADACINNGMTAEEYLELEE